MDSLEQLVLKIKNGDFDSRFQKLYPGDVLPVRERYLHLADLFYRQYGDISGARFFSAPGRTEVCGNHTDHNHGAVLAAAIDLDAVALAAKTDDDTIYVKSEKYEMDAVCISELTPKAAEKDKSLALVRGVAARFVQLGYKIGGLKAVTVNNVLRGSGMSSSASFEVLVGTVLNYLYNDGKISPVEIAKIAQYAENEFFGKPCGLMDQMACSVGGFVQIDFADPAVPVITPVTFDFASCGHSLCIVDTRADHADLTPEYAAIRSEMEAVAHEYGKSCLREVKEEQIIADLEKLRKKLGERPVLRALHFYADNNRVAQEAIALKNGDFEAFKQLTVESGFSSFMYNQNVFAASDCMNQPVSLALALTQKLLNGKGAFRVHGGGFAGTIQAFVPNEMLDEYKNGMEQVFGKGACYVLSIRPIGGTEV